MEQKNCPHCGQGLEISHFFCPHCGIKLTECRPNMNQEEGNPIHNADISPIQNASYFPDNQPYPPYRGEEQEGVNYLVPSQELSSFSPANQGLKRLLVVIGVMLVVGIGFYYTYQQKQAEILHHYLQNNIWMTIEDDTYLFLNFDQTGVDYSGDFGIIGKKNIARMNYQIQNGDEIVVHGSTIQVEMKSDDGFRMVIFTPSFVDTQPYSVWIEGKAS